MRLYSSATSLPASTAMNFFFRGFLALTVLPFCFAPKNVHDVMYDMVKRKRGMIMDYVEIILNGRVFTDTSMAEELLQKAGLAKTQKFEYFCDIIGHVGRLIEHCGGTAAKIIYDYDRKSGIIRCSISMLKAENGMDGSLYFFKYMINRVDVFEMKPVSADEIQLTFEIRDIFAEEQLCLTA